LPSETATEDLFEIANLFPATTGLPMTLWVSPRGDARHDVRVKVNMTHGNQMNAANTAVFRWVSLNEPALVACWDGQIDTIQLGHLLKPLPPAP
jgi:hypothetical protein